MGHKQTRAAEQKRDRYSRGSFRQRALCKKQLRITGMMVGSRQAKLDTIRAINASDIRPLIDATFSLDELRTAFRHQEPGAHFKIVIEL
jgi:D-arabinose 1-dehydrogenase-like Zn-dependent alcohol dehydrogenase